MRKALLINIYIRKAFQKKKSSSVEKGSTKISSKKIATKIRTIGRYFQLLKKQCQNPYKLNFNADIFVIDHEPNPYVKSST